MVAELRASGIVGISAVGLAGLSGCSSWFVPGNQGQGSVVGESFSKGRPDGTAIQGVLDQLKKALQTFHEKNDGHGAIALARQATERMFAHFDKTGFTDLLQKHAQESLLAYSGLSQEQAAKLKEMGFYDPDVEQLQNAVRRARADLLSKSQVNFKKIMAEVLSRLRGLEGQDRLPCKGMWLLKVG